MMIIETMASFHNDNIYAIAFDWYGKRLATSSADNSIKIWRKEQG